MKAKDLIKSTMEIEANTIYKFKTKFKCFEKTYHFNYINGPIFTIFVNKRFFDSSYSIAVGINTRLLKNSFKENI